MSEGTILPAATTPDRGLVEEIAMDIGQAAVSYLRVMYPAAHATLGPSGHTSLRNWLRNEIMAALDTMDADGIRARLESRREHRHILHRAWDDIRKRDEAAGVAAREHE